MGKEFKTYKKTLYYLIQKKYPNASTSTQKNNFIENPLTFSSCNEGVCSSVRKIQRRKWKNNSPLQTEFL